MRRFPNPKSNVFNVGRFRSIHRLVLFCSLLLVLMLQECIGQQQKMAEMFRQMEQKLKENPRDSKLRYELAWSKILDGKANESIQLLYSAFNDEVVDVPLHKGDNWLYAFMAAHFIGRWAIQKDFVTMASQFTSLAYDVSVAVSPSGEVGETCTSMQLATTLEKYPASNQAVDDSVARMEEMATRLINLKTQNHPDVFLNVDFLKTMPGFSQDPYVHCVYSLFALSFYYRADVAKIANLNYQVGVLFFPDLLYVAPHVEKFEKEQQELRQLNGIAAEDGGIIQQCVDRKIKLAVICSTITEHHSVSEDFGGVLQRLDRNVFDVDYHVLHENTVPGTEASFTKANPTDQVFNHGKTDRDIDNGAWTKRIGKEIEKFEYDMIYYLDLTMGTYVRRLASSRLAPVQINSHGHPVTSGIPRHTIQHFVSWAEAELPIEESQDHYTEELQLIPKGKIHQYYTPRVQRFENGMMSTRVGNNFFHEITRKEFMRLPENIRNSSPDDEDIHLYVCMQKPFKLFPEFDELICGVLQKDPQGHVILHEEDTEQNKEVFVTRLKAAGCDMDRVHFLYQQPSHRLMALYNTATVILDSYPAGGCTTSREAFEMGKAIVTWPARLLGGRWTLGLYNIMGLDDDSKAKVIANSKEDYISKAVELGTNKELRQKVEKNILEAIPNIFGRKEAVEEWEKIFLRISPVKQCKDVTSDADRILDKDEL